MSTLREITVFTNGDSSLISTWSNVPFCFTTAFESRGIRVNRIDLSPHKTAEKLFQKTVLRILNRIFKKNSYDYFRSPIHFLYVRYKIKKAIKQYPFADALVFLTFSFSAPANYNRPVIQFGDWTYEHYIRYFENRKPNFIERFSVRREDQQINRSSIVFPLFPGVAKTMKSKYRSKIKYLGNVVNAVHAPEEQIVLQLKRESETILFIGSPKYIEGATALLKAYNLLKPTRSFLSLHFIGLTEADIGEVPSGVICYGYLDKGNVDQRQLYYKLLTEASVFVNTTPKWSAFSASLEAMYFYTPVIVPKYEEFVETFGHKLSGGMYCVDNAYLSNCIEAIIDSPFYLETCKSAHKLVEGFSWHSYIEKMTQEVETL